VEGEVVVNFAEASRGASPAPPRPGEVTPGATPPSPAAVLPGTEPFANRLRKNLRHLGKWARREGISCFRVYDADLPDYAVAVDLYEGWANVQEYAAPPTVDPAKAATRLRDVMAVLPGVLGLAPGRVVLKVRRRQRGPSQYGRLGDRRAFHEVSEAGLRFFVNLTDYLDTGLFLDHRLTRALVRGLAGGRDFLNLFAYTGTASVYAAAGGARTTTTVDLSATYLDWARRNMARNGFAEGRSHRFLRADCLAWLATPHRRRYGLIFVDPPTFSNSKGMGGRTFEVQRDHARLIRAAARLLAPGGILLFSNNFRQFRMDRAALAEFVVEELTAATLPLDFQRNRRIHNSWKITRRPANSLAFPVVGSLE
jgi:23S rRNA (guanine2445-N2)-methyltransferase / 23S rRNA (guanine2069-N7)-methyltransferase